VEDARGLGFSSDGYLDGDDYDGRFLGLSVRGVHA
jgi:hypothetical protein